jgi:hypothetical protein
MDRRVEKFSNEEDRRRALLASKLRYALKPWTCEFCNVTIQLGHKSRHSKSEKHKLKTTIEKE